MIIIYRAADAIEANLICGMLRAEGIEASVGGHHQQSGVGELAPQDFAVVYLLDERDRLLAKELIEAYERGDQALKDDHSEPVADEMPPPEKPALPKAVAWLLVIGLLLLFFIVGLMREPQ